jgi:hypothetical protein
MYRPYVQDDWRVSKNLTLNLGLAWAIVTPESEAFNRQANFLLGPQTFLIAGQNANKYAGVNMDWKALEPRIGLAWKPWGSQTTVLRGGYAIYHDSSWNMGAQGLWQNPPYYYESDAFAFGGGCPFATSACATKYGLTPYPAISLSQGFPIQSTPPSPNAFTGTINVMNPNFKQGQVQQFNVNVEHQLPGQVLLTAGYAGSRASHILVYGNNLNVGSPGACGTTAGYTLGCGPGGAAFGVPETNFPYSTIDNMTDDGRAHYNSLQIKAETKSARHGLYALIGYTYARNYDSGYTDGLGSNLGAPYYPLPGWQKLDWGLSQINLNNDFTASVIYELPFGKGKAFGSDWNGPVNAILGNWEVTGIQKVTSGFPVFVVADNNSGVNFENNGNSLNRPNQVCNPVLSNPTINAWFNTSCFVAPQSGELGNASRTPLSGPDFVNTDFSAIKHFLVPGREGMKVDLRAEVFNLFNHPQFGTPGSSICAACPLVGAAGFGSINTTVNNPRLFQFALKFLF